ncbi:MAG TPA: hypothetical protein VFS20_22070 [Longimicrobium sp.]|nr:hypothetical protein [Longimicrobium sp.]
MSEILGKIDWPRVLYFFITMFGASSMYVFSLMKGWPVSFLKRVLPGREQVFYDRLDFAVVVTAGSIIGYIFFSPASELEALAAGFGWVGAINVLMNPNQESGGRP